MAPPSALPAAALRWRCDPAALGFATTQDLADPDGVVGQARAVEAIRLGVGLKRPGFNLFLLGPSGLGKRTTIERFLAEEAARGPAPSDWCYVHNFEEAHRPRALRLPAGRGAVLRVDMERLVESLRAAVPAAFDSDDYRTRRQIVEDEFRERQEQALRAVQEAARERGIALMRTPVGFSFAPVREGKVMSPEAFHALPQEERAKIEGDMAAMQERMAEVMQHMPRWAKETREKIAQLNRETMIFAVGNLIDDLQRDYADVANVAAWLRAVQEDMVGNAEAFLRQHEGREENGDNEGEEGTGRPSRRAALGSARGPFARYAVNLLVGHDGQERAPVVVEENPTHDNLLGRVEHRAEMGALVTDFTLVKAGALHRANGGYLVVEAHKLLAQPYAWDGLKQALRTREIKIESLGQRVGLISTVSLEPETIPLDVKVVLIGDRLLYYLLAEYDPEFGEHFKVAADFDDRMERTPESSLLYARLVAQVARRHAIRPLDAAAVALVAEESARAAADAERLSLQVSATADLLAEADHYAREAGSATVGAVHVAAAVDARARRHGRVRERMQEETLRGSVLIDTAGARVGQINGLSVMALGGHAFGRPSRITARVRLGRGEVVDIERETRLGGPLHSKGVLILAGYLGARYAADLPLSLSATIVMEQSYGGVDGDSASSTELYAILSALAEAPIRQSLAVTGSVNQLGQVQAIGGANEKIEGFFDLCAARGLAGDEGVLIPAANVKHLMLHRRVVEAAERGRFHVYPVATIDEGIALLTGIPAGEADAQGHFPPDTINGRVQARLRAFSEARRRFGAAAFRDGAAP